MASSLHRTVAIAAESTFASISSSTGAPDVSGLTFSGLEFEGPDISIDYEHEAVDLQRGRASSYHVPPDPTTIYSSGSALRRGMGTVTLTVPWRTIGSSTAYTAYAGQNMPIHMLINSGMATQTPSPTAESADAATSTTEFDANATTWVEGQAIAWEKNGRVEWSFITDVDTNTVKHSPAFSAGVGVADEVWAGQTYHNALGTSAVGQSVAIRIDVGGSMRIIATGCRWESVSCEHRNRQAFLTFVMRCAVIQEDNSNSALADPTLADGEIAQLLGSYIVRSSTAIGTTAPAELARATIDCDEVSWSITNTLVGLGRSDDIAGLSEFEVTDTTAQATLTTSALYTSYEDDYINQTERSLLVGYGPTGQGNGACFYLPAAHLTADAGVYDLGGGVLRHVYEYRNGLWNLDNSGMGTASDTGIRLAMRMKSV